MPPSLRTHRDRSRLVDCAAIVFLLALYYAWPLLMPDMVYHGGDATLLTYPNRLLLRESILQGIIPLWNPYAGMGVPALAEYQGAFLYPLNWLASLYHPMTGTRIIAFVHVIIQAFGMYFMARSGFGLGRSAATFAAVVQGVSAWNAAHVEQFMIAAAASWTPFILLGWISYLRSPSYKAFLLTVGALTTAILSGHSQYWIYTLDAMALLLIFGPSSDGAHNFKQCLRQKVLNATALMLLGIAAFGVSAAQILPTLELAKHSERVIDPAEYGMHSSFPPGHLIYYFDPLRMPRWYEETNPYLNPVEMMPFVGRITVVLGLLATILLSKRRNTWVLLVWYSVFLCISFGQYLPGDGAFFRFLQRVMPGWHGLRVPARLIYMANIALIMLAAHGLHHLAARLKNRKVAFAVACAAVLMVVAEQYPVSMRLPLRNAAPFVPPQPTASVPSFTAEQQGVFRVFRLIDTVPIARFDPLAHAARIATLEPNAGIYGAAGTVRAYVEGLLPLLRTEDFLRAYWRNFYTATPDAELLGLMNVRFLAADKPVYGSDWRPVASLPPSEPDRRPITIFENQRYRERVYSSEDVAGLDPGTLDGNFERTGVPSAAAAIPRPLQPGNVSRKTTVEQINVNQLAVGQIQPSQTLLLSGSAYPGWTVLWPGGRQELEMVNAMHMRFSVPPEVKDVRLHFQPFSFRLGLFLSLISLGTIALWLGLTMRVRKS